MRLYMHATRDISKILKEYGAKADIVMCMNASYWVLKKVARKGARVYVATCSDLERAKKEGEEVRRELFTCMGNILRCSYGCMFC